MRRRTCCGTPHPEACASRPAFGGSKDAVVVAHTHNIRVNTNAAGFGFPTFEAASAQGTFATESTGVSGVDKNMQPYIVLLKIMKL